MHQISNNFKKNLFTSGLFIDLSKVLDTVDHETLIFKLKKYRVGGNNLQMFRSCLSHWKQFIKYGNLNTTFNDIVCSVHQGSVLGELLFLIYEIDLQHVSKTLDPIMFADNTDLF